jgi:translocation and assembly module TamB
MSETTPSSPQPHSRKPASASRRLSRWLIWIVFIVVGCAILLVALLFAAVRTESGTRLLWQLTTHLLPDTLSGQFDGGTLKDGLHLQNLNYRDASRHIHIDRISGSWHLSYSPLSLTIDSFQIGKADITLLPTPPKPLTLPQHIALPLAIDIKRATARQLLIHKETSTTELDDLAFAFQSDRLHHKLSLMGVTTPYGAAGAELQLTGNRPFPLSGSMHFNSTFQDKGYQANAKLSGSLEALGIQLVLNGTDLAGNAQVDAAPFSDMPLRRAQINLHHVDPKAFYGTAPHADLEISADLVPTSTAPSTSSQFVVAGPVSITNASPGPIDKSLLPLNALQTDVTLDMQQQRLSNLKIALPGHATLEGNADLQHTGKGQLALQANKLNLQALYSKLRSTQLSGPLTVDLDGKLQHIALQLTDPAFKVQAAAALSPEEIKLDSAQINVGTSRVTMTGTLGRDTKSPYSIEGKLENFNPAVFIAAVQGKQKNSHSRTSPKIPNAHINAELQAKGALHPELQADVSFFIYDSTYQGLPMKGTGSVHLAGQRLLPSKADLQIAGNNVLLDGSFGAPSDHLNLKIDAPALARIGFGLSGLLQLDAHVGGTIQRPLINATYHAEQLAYDRYHLAHLAGEAHVQGIPGTASNARLMLNVDATGVQSGEFNLNKLQTKIDGTYASHTINANATGTLRGKPLALTVAAQGQLRDTPQGLAWNGIVRTLKNDGLPRFMLTQPLSVSAASNQILLGATHLTIEQANIDLKNFSYQHGALHSEGTVSDLNVGQLLQLQQEFTGVEPPVKTNLVLDGRWNITLTDTASGFIQIDRRSGDITIVGSQGATALGLSAAKLRADLSGRQINLDTHIDATRIGSMRARAQVELQQVDGRLIITPDAPVSGHVTASLPSLQSVGSLAGPRVALEGNIVADLSIAGVVGQPELTGDITGDRLAMTLFDQGIRLRDGIARIHIENNIAEMREVVLHGGDGTLRATGRIPLDQSHPDLTVSIVADHLQLISDPSMQLTLSGQAQAANIGEQLQINGKFTVDRALLSLPEKAAPKLSDDVVVVHAGSKVPPKSAVGTAQPASRFSPYTHIEIGLGNDFRFKGAGADLQMTGAITVQSAPAQVPQASGIVHIVSGTYEAFGTKLAIEQGIIEFTGPFTNPNINILAMRRGQGQDVAAGVQITGNVQQPHVTLVSEPDVPDEEKLSWLVFGRSGGSTDPGQAQSAAKGAALGLINTFGGGRIAKGLGLSQLSVGTSEYGLGTQQVVNIGKEVSDRLFIGYEQSLNGIGSVVKLTYEFSKNWSVVLRGGAIGGLDLLYNRRFDKLKQQEHTQH